MKKHLRRDTTILLDHFCFEYEFGNMQAKIEKILCKTVNIISNTLKDVQKMDGKKNCTDENTTLV